MYKRNLFLFAKRLGQIPVLRRPIIRLWNTYEHILFVHSARRNLSVQPLVAQIDPLLLYRFSPERIKEMSASSFDFIRDTGRIIDGSWDKNPREIKKTPKYECFNNRFLQDASWEDISYYKRTKNEIEAGKHNRYATVAEFEEKLATYDRIYNQFRSGEYRLQSELVAENGPQTPSDGGKALLPSLTNHTLLRHEITVNVGRHGTFLRNDGRHRLALALLAGLDEIPVRIVVRHREWQALRDRVARTIDEALNNCVEKDNIKSHVSDVLSTDLKDVDDGLNHPDLNIIFNRRLRSDRSTTDQHELTVPWLSVDG